MKPSCLAADCADTALPLCLHWHPAMIWTDRESLPAERLLHCIRLQEELHGHIHSSVHLFNQTHTDQSKWLQKIILKAKGVIFWRHFWAHLVLSDPCVFQKHEANVCKRCSQLLAQVLQPIVTNITFIQAIVAEVHYWNAHFATERKRETPIWPSIPATELWTTTIS